VDAIAERMVARGERPPTTLAEHLQTSGLKEDGQNREAAEMVAQVAQDLRFLGDSLRTAAHQAADANDETTANLLDAFADGEEKERWMLEAFLSA
jgi:starvation-inducible DNA-binding protein